MKKNVNNELHSKENLIDEGMDDELAKWMKNKYEAYDVTWKDVKYQVWSANVSYLFFLIEGVLFGFSNLKSFTTQSDINESWLVITIGSVLIGTLLSGPLMDQIGRKKANLMVAVPCTIAWLMIFFPLSDSSFFKQMERCLVGLAMGLETASLVYTSEISHKKYRAFLLSLSTFSFAFGIHLMRILENFLPLVLIVVLTGGLLFATIILVAYFIPESPVWLASYRGDLTEAKQSMKWLNPNIDVFDDEWKEMTRTMEAEKEWTKKYDFILLSPHVYKPLVVSFILLTLQQATFLHAFIIHTPKVLSKINPDSSEKTGYENFLYYLGICRFLANIISCILYLKVGRRIFFMVSSVGMTVTSILLLILLQFDLFDNFGWNKIVLFTLFIIFGSVGVMTIPWLLPVELLPHGARSVGCTVVTFYANLLLFLFEFILPSVLETFSVVLLFTFIAAISALMSVIFYCRVPETFDRSFGEIQLDFIK